MPEQSTQEYRKAIELAQQERSQLLERLKGLQKLQQRVGQLDTFIEQGKLLLGIPSESTESISTPDEKSKLSLGSIDDTPKPLYLRMAQIIRETRRPMTLSEMVVEFRKREWKLSDKNPREVLRNTAKTKPQVFVKTGQGEGGQALYGLKEQSPEQ